MLTDGPLIKLLGDLSPLLPVLAIRSWNTGHASKTKFIQRNSGLESNSRIENQRRCRPGHCVEEPSRRKTPTSEAEGTRAITSVCCRIYRPLPTKHWWVLMLDRDKQSDRRTHTGQGPLPTTTACWRGLRRSTKGTHSMKDQTTSTELHVRKLNFAKETMRYTKKNCVIASKCQLP
jgi:hypothetical protein